jgi:hypothetical protein
VIDQRDLFSRKELELPHPVRFDGDDYVPERDNPRLTGQILRVFDVMKDGVWRSLAEICADIEMATGHHDPEASISAQLRHLRKKRFGSYTIERKHEGDGLYRYRLPDD